jgi:ATP-dependent DNA ligase
VVLDLLSTDKDHMQEPLIERKARLASIVEPGSLITPTMYTNGSGIQLKRQTEDSNWEGCCKEKGIEVHARNTVRRLVEDEELERK